MSSNKKDKMKDLMKYVFLLLVALGIISGCSKEDDPNLPEASELTQKINKFIKTGMDEFYLWNDEMPDIDYKYELNSEEYFDKLLFVDDKEKHWSFITEDIEALLASFAGIETGYGWSLGRGEFTNTGTLFAVVLYVYPNTPAANAGIERGDFIIQMNNGDITKENYDDLFDSDNVTVTLGVDTGDGITVGSTVNLAAEKLTLNPVVKTAVVEHDNHKIGYIFYAQYIENFTFALDTALESLANKGVTDLVIDLRYNGGGHISAAQHLCSSLAPLNIVNEESVLIKMFWNEKRQKEWVDGQIMYLIETLFDKSVDVKLGLGEIYFLTGPGTASASELTITGLNPYMNVTTIGGTTHGKYTGSRTITPEVLYNSEDYYKEFKNWAIQPIVLRYANISHDAFKDGLAPIIEIEDDYSTPLGTIEEPLFKAAIEEITQSPVIAMKSAKKLHSPFKIYEQKTSRFEESKNKLLIDNFDFKPLK